MKFYAGIGSRSTPDSELAKMTSIASFLEGRGYTLRSGGAEGADKAFESGVFQPSMKEILRPKHATKEAQEIASKVHPAWHMCNEYVRQLHGRNAQIVLGKNLDHPIEFMIAYTISPTVGGTSLGIKLAQQRNIPVFNMAERVEVIALGAFLVSLR